MYKSSKKIFVFVLLVAVFLSSVFSSYKIVDYEFKIDGHTKRWALLSRVKDSEDTFESVEDLEAALKEKRQQLWNTNVFTSVKCSWEEVETVGDTVNVKAVFEIVDSGAAILLPYPKYDSNTGFSLGLRYKNNNVLGTLGAAAVSFDWVQNGTEFDKSTFEFEVPVENILLSNGSSLYFELAGNYNMANPTDGKLKFSTGITNLVIKDIVFESSVGAAYLYDEKTVDNFSFNLSAKGIKVGEILLDASTKALINRISSIKNSSIVTSLSVRKIEVGNVTITDTLTYTVAPSSSADISSLTSSKLVNATKFSIKSDKIKNLSVGTEVGLLFLDKYQYYTLSFAFNPINKITSTTKVTGYTSETNGLYAIKASQAFSSSFKVEVLGKKITISPSVELINKNAETYVIGNRAWELDSSLTVSGGSINRVTSGESYFAFRDNFRTGVTAEAQAKMVWNFGQNPNLIVRGATTAFFHPLKNFNPSFRVYAAGAAEEIEWFNQSSGKTYANANLYTFSDYTMTKDGLNTLVRGVRLDSHEIQSTYKTNYMLYFSMNLTTSFLYFEDFGHMYISPFLDVAMFSNNFAKKTEVVSGIGVEAYMIMDSHASYPIRVSLGFDLEDLINKAKGQSTGLDYEVFIGLGFLY